MPSQSRLIDLSRNAIVGFGSQSMPLPFLAKLIVSYNSISIITPGVFLQMRNLLVLDLSYNILTTLNEGTFAGLASLIHLSLEGNTGLHTLHAGAFQGLSQLPTLNLSGMAIVRLDDMLFHGLDKLTVLDLSDNVLDVISDATFDDLFSLVTLNLRRNPISRISAASVAWLPSLSTLESDHFKLCCIASQVKECYPPQDPIASCEDLMNRPILRVFIWLLGTLACFGNICVVIWRFWYKSGAVPDIIICNLAISDLLMGTYMLIIAGVDLYYRGVFIEYSDIWRQSVLCHLAGFLATLSSEASVMFLCLLTTDRFISIIFPFSSKKLTTSSTKGLSLVIWMIGFLVSVAPFVLTGYFGKNYYGRSAVCMALPITNVTPPGMWHKPRVARGYYPGLP